LFGILEIAAPQQGGSLARQLVATSVLMRSSAICTRFGGGVPFSACQRQLRISSFSVHCNCGEGKFMLSLLFFE
jgi:hypothetical protein